MGSFKLGKMTLSSMFKKPETIQYPTEQRFAPKGRKGHVAITIEECILCGICMKRCPTGAITVEKAEKTWTIDRFRCVQCGSCVRECPKSCLRMEANYAPVATKKFLDTVVQKEDEAAKKAKEAEKAARIEAAKKAKAAREAKSAQ